MGYVPEQPPSGGCVLKLLRLGSPYSLILQPPSGGCVLKPQIYRKNLTLHLQPPSGGCVLKPQVAGLSLEKQQAAAFGRLCVETALI